MSKLVLAANTITGEEKGWGLFELNQIAPDNSAVHRYQIVQVIRDGQIAEWRRDMGLASTFKGINQLRIPSLLEHSCQELMDLADELRGEKGIDLDDLLQLDDYKLA